MYRYFFKRMLDFFAALIGLIIISPIIVLVAIVLYFNNDGKPFFFQERPGKESRIFKIIKFKTMNDKKDPFGNLLPDSQRLTKLGAFIRKTSLDELPQLINVVRGDMSFIGPRPLRVEYLPIYSERQKKRHNIRPGITGWAQVNGRNTISWSKKFEYDVWYFENLSLLLDVRIVFLTIKKVFLAKDINAGEGITMERFNGNN